MGKITAVLLIAACATLQLWAQDSLPPSASTSSPQSAASPDFPLDHFQNFSAVQNGGPLPGMNADRHIYRSGNLMRMQGDADVPEYYVTDLKKQNSHAVSSAGCLEMGSAYKLSFPFFVSAAPNVTYERIPIGEEVIDGHQCHVEDVLIHNPKNPVVLHFRLSEAQDLDGFPLKIENRREGAYAWVIHYKDVKLGPPDPSLFLIPNKCETMAGFQKVSPAPKRKTTAPAKP